MPAIRSWSSTFRVRGQPGPASSCTMAARYPPPSVIPRAIRRIPYRGTSCLSNTGSWGAVCCLRTGLTRSPSACDLWSPPRTWRRSGVCSVPPGNPLPRARLHWEPFQQPAGDDEPLDLVRAFAHSEELRVTEVALHGQLLNIAHAAVDLHGLTGAELGGLGGEELGHAGLEVAALACRLEPGRLVGQELGGLDACRHVGELGLDELVLRDGLPKGLTLLGIADRVLEGRPGQADAARRHIDAPALEGTHDHREARVLLAEQILQRHARVLKDDLARAQPTVAQLLQMAADPEARRALVDEQAGDAPRLGPRWIGADKHAKHGAVLGIGDKHLRAVDDPLVLLSTCRGTQRRGVRARARFGQCHAGVPLAGGHLRK